MVCPDCKDELNFFDYYGIPILDKQIHILGSIYICQNCNVPRYHDIQKNNFIFNLPEYTVFGGASTYE